MASTWFMVFVLILIDFCNGSTSSRSDWTIQVLYSKEGHVSEAKWYNSIFCNEGLWVVGFQFKSEGNQGNDEDDTSGNGVKLKCANPDGTITEWIETNNPKNWGSWSSTEECARGYLKSYKSKVEDDTVDDTALNCLEFECSNGHELMPDNCNGWGSWDSSGYMSCSAGSYICGFSEKFEPDESVWEGELDESGLNAVRFFCCAYTPAPTNSPTKAPTPAPTSAPTSATGPPTPAPTDSPTDSPTKAPTGTPTGAPTMSPTEAPTYSPGRKQGGFNTSDGLSTHTLLVALLAVFGGLVFLLIMGILLYVCWWKKRDKGHKPSKISQESSPNPINANITGNIALEGIEQGTTTKGTTTKGTNSTNVTNGFNGTNVANVANATNVTAENDLYSDDSDDDIMASPGGKSDVWQV